MSESLPRLLKTYQFLDLALSEYGTRMASDELRRLRTELASTFSGIVSHTSDDVRVTVAQLRFIISNLDRMSVDDGISRELQSACLQHLDRIASHVAPTRDTPPKQQAQPPLARLRVNALSDASLRQLDLLSDRVGVLDTSLRFLFTNTANAKFHAMPADAFIGRPIWRILGTRFFEAVSRPRLEQCLAGQAASCIASPPGRDPSIVYASRFDPVRDESGDVTAILIVSRDISHIPVPPEMLACRPDQ